MELHVILSILGIWFLVLLLPNMLRVKALVCPIKSITLYLIGRRSTLRFNCYYSK